MSRRQIVLLILVNALISLLISVAVVWGAAQWWPKRSPTYAPLPLATATKGPTAAREEILYIVQAGDSLSGIAARFQVSLDDLMRANNITDADYISAGQRLIIPAGPLPTPPFTPTSTATILPFEPPTARPNQAATPSPAPTDTRMPAPSASAPPPHGTPTLTTAHGSSAQPPLGTPTTPAGEPTTIELQGPTGAGDLLQEALTIVNAGASDVLLKDWVLLGDGGRRYVFPALTLASGGNVVLHSGAGQDSASDLFWGLDAPVWTSGKTITLLDSAGALVAERLVP